MNASRRLTVKYSNRSDIFFFLLLLLLNTIKNNIIIVFRPLLIYSFTQFRNIFVPCARDFRGYRNPINNYITVPNEQFPKYDIIMLFLRVLQHEIQLILFLHQPAWLYNFHIHLIIFLIIHKYPCRVRSGNYLREKEKDVNTIYPKSNIILFYGTVLVNILNVFMFGYCNYSTLVCIAILTYIFHKYINVKIILKVNRININSNRRFKT